MHCTSTKLLSIQQCADGDTDAAVEARIQTGWNKFRQLVALLTNRDISLIRRGRLRGDSELGAAAQWDSRN